MIAVIRIRTGLTYRRRRPAQYSAVRKPGRKNRQRSVRQILPSTCSVSWASVCPTKCRTVSACGSTASSPQCEQYRPARGRARRARADLGGSRRRELTPLLPFPKDPADADGDLDARCRAAADGSVQRDVIRDDTDRLERVVVGERQLRVSGGITDPEAAPRIRPANGLGWCNVVHLHDRLRVDDQALPVPSRLRVAERVAWRPLDVECCCTNWMLSVNVSWRRWGRGMAAAPLDAAGTRWCRIAACARLPCSATTSCRSGWRS